MSHLHFYANSYCFRQFSVISGRRDPRPQSFCPVHFHTNCNELLFLVQIVGKCCYTKD